MMRLKKFWVKSVIFQDKYTNMKFKLRLDHIYQNVVYILAGGILHWQTQYYRDTICYVSKSILTINLTLNFTPVMTTLQILIMSNNMKNFLKLLNTLEFKPIYRNKYFWRVSANGYVGLSIKLGLSYNPLCESLLLKLLGIGRTIHIIIY